MPDTAQTRRTPALMIQGTGSDVGKSLIVAGLCRAFTRRGLSVLPFKPQNMSNNAAITADGGEIGRAQALQARACRADSTVHMNPVLLKPESDRGSQVVVQGHVRDVVQATEYLSYRRTLMPDVLDSFGRLCDSADLVVVEGAGSAAEVNLSDGDIANMGFALAADVPVVLLADIDRGGSLASIVGTYHLLSEPERALLCGYMINKFRGDYSVFEPSIEIIRRYTGLPCLGVLQWFDAASKLPAEDSLALGKKDGRASGADGCMDTIRIAVLQLSRISNFDDFDALAAEGDVELSFVKPGEAIPGDADLVILPGTKSTLADMDFLRAQGWDVDIAAHLRRGGRVLGICGGYQILGKRIEDPHGIESPAGSSVEGLGLLDVVTVMAEEKTLRTFTAVTPDGLDVGGYEIHMGRTAGPDADRPMMHLDDVPEGAVSPDGKVSGCYIHGLFTSDSYRKSFLASFRSGRKSDLRYEDTVDETLDELADHVERYVDMEKMAKIAGL